MNTRTLIAAAGVAALTLAGCSTLPEQVDQLEQARTVVGNVDSNPMAEKVAGGELSKAKKALSRAETAYENDEDLTVIKHDAYLATRHAQIAQERIDEVQARQAIEDSEAERTKVLLKARDKEARQARNLAAMFATEAQKNARRAEMQEDRADAALATARALSNELDELKAEQTARGLVLTLSNILFDTDKAELKPGAEDAMDRLAGFMKEYPEHRLLIEGHTDSRGPESYNESLSQRRANAVRNALVDRGISNDRLLAKGMGETHPVASNQTVAGRQENRRVEIVVSDDSGSFPDAARRTASRL